jgi:hypothetical protein
MWPALILVAIGWVLSLLFVLVVLVEGHAGIAEVSAGFATATAALGLLWAGIFLARKNLARVRQSRKKSEGASILAIWHKNDEAISFLRSVEFMRIEAFPKWALFRGARRNAFPFAISIAVASLLILPALSALEYVLNLLSRLDMYLRYGWGNLSFPWAELLISELWVALAAPVTFSGAYVAYLLIFGLVGGASAELLFRAPLNRFITRVFCGIAFGRDSDQMVGNVSPTSHAFETIEFVIDGETAERMKTQSERAANALLEKYRWSLFNVGENREASLAAMAQDALTWDSLIHTTYFDQPELADIISNHISKHAPRSGSIQARVANPRPS